MTESITVEEFADLCTRVLRTQGYSDEEVETCTDEFVDAQCRGVNTHGAAIIPLYLEFMHEGSRGPITVSKETPVSAYVEGNDNAGPAVARRAMDIAIEKAKATGVGIVGANNRAPYCCAGFNPRRAAREGLIGINFSTGGYIDFPAHGGMDPIMASNPLGIAVPSRQGPVTLDMSFSTLGGGAGSEAGVRHHKAVGVPIPEGAALSKEGRPTTDLEEVLEGIVVFFGGHKGAGLSLMLDLIGRPLVGGKIDNANPRVRSMTFIALRPDLFVSEEQFLDDVSQLAARVKNSKPRPGFSEVMLPGERGERFLAACKADGIPILDKPLDDKAGVAIERSIYEELQRLAVEQIDEVAPAFKRKRD